LELKGTALQFVSQNGVTILPFVGKTRRFVLSFYAKLDPTENGLWGILGCNKNNVIDKQKIGFFGSGLSPTAFTRIAATFDVTVPSITNISVVFGNYDGVSPMYVDAVQLEEKTDGLPPRDYYDTKSVTADYLQGNLIRGHMIEADSIYTNHLQVGSITASLLAANSVLASSINANVITIDKLKLTNTAFFGRPHDIMRISPCSIAATVGGITLATATTNEQDYEYAHVFAGFQRTAALGTFLVTGMTSLSLTPGSLARQSAHDTGLLGTTYTHDYPLICRPYPCATTSRTVLVLFKQGPGYPTGVIDTYYSSRKTGAKGTGSATYARYLMNSNDSVWTTPAVLATLGSSILVSVKHNPVTGSFLIHQGHRSQLYSAIPYISANRSFFTFMTSGGTVTRQIRKVYSNYYGESDFDFCGSGATILFATHKNGVYFTGAKATIEVFGCQTSNLSVTVPTIYIATYAGLSASANLDQAKKPSVVYTNITRIVGNRFLLTYQLTYNPHIFYKILEKIGNTVSVIYPKNEDISLYTNSAGYEELPNNSIAGRPRTVKLHGDSVLAYSAAKPKRQSAGSKYPLGGTAVTVSKIAATINFDMLLNRMG
jgi:hypothetical protein